MTTIQTLQHLSTKLAAASADRLQQWPNSKQGTASTKIIVAMDEGVRHLTAGDLAKYAACFERARAAWGGRTKTVASQYRVEEIERLFASIATELSA